MLRCAITHNTSVAEDAAAQRARLLEQAHRWAVDGIELVQLREKHLEAGALLELAEAMLRVLRDGAVSSTKLLINGRADIAVAAGADGVHLTSRPGEVTPEQVRVVFAQTGKAAPVVSVSCHTLDEVQQAREGGTNYILFGPTFEKRLNGHAVQAGVGIDRLREACELAQPVPVLALGGITLANANQCMKAGAFGIAGIRLFR